MDYLDIMDAKENPYIVAEASEERTKEFLNSLED